MLFSRTLSPCLDAVVLVFQGARSLLSSGRTGGENSVKRRLPLLSLLDASRRANPNPPPIIATSRRPVSLKCLSASRAVKNVLLGIQDFRRSFATFKVPQTTTPGEVRPRAPSNLPPWPKPLFEWLSTEFCEAPRPQG